MYAIRSYYVAEFQTLGDWRLYFVYRDRLRAVTSADVQRVAETYLRRDNRVLGAFVPTESPQRAEIVITSYSIHYTKLYESFPPRPFK